MKTRPIVTANMILAMRIILFSCMTLLGIPVLFGASYNICDFGAVGDGKTLNTSAIQKAIEACRRNGAGTVLVPGGTFLSGALRLYGNMDLHLEKGAILKGSANLADYMLEGKRVGLLYSENAENISLTGLGNIDGNGDAFMDLHRAKQIENAALSYTRQKERFRLVTDGLGDGPVVPLERPFQMIIFSNCRNLALRDLLITNSPFWTVHFADCDGVEVSGVKLWNNLLVANGDGIDFTSCSNVLVSNCDIRTGDDALVLAGYDHHFDLPGYKKLRHPSENVTVTNCTLVSRSSGIRIGGADQNNMRNYLFSNLVISGSNRGIGIFARDEGSIEDITFSNIVIKTRLHTGDWWGNGEPIHLSAVRNKEQVTMGKIRNVKFSHIIAEGESGILVYGSAESPIENVTFHDVAFKLKKSPLNEVAGGNFDLRPVLDPKLQLFSHDIPAFYAEQVRNMEIHDFDLTWEAVGEPFFTYGIEMQKFENVIIDGFNGDGAPGRGNAPAILLKDGHQYRVSSAARKSATQAPVLATEDVRE